ncbi:Hypothetical protein POVR1_LOCUS301 [uncultured virus]|nr:Hypothetical protein POVR1_LOCUS301 [uncultured virus]
MDQDEISLHLNELPEKLKNDLLDHIENQYPSQQVTSIVIDDIDLVRQLPLELRSKIGSFTSTKGYLVSREAMRSQETELARRRLVAQRLLCEHPLSINEIRTAFEVSYPAALIRARAHVTDVMISTTASPDLFLLKIHVPSLGAPPKKGFTERTIYLPDGTEVIVREEAHRNIDLILLIEVKITRDVVDYRSFSRPDLITDSLIRSNRPNCNQPGIYDYLLIKKYNIYYSSTKFLEFKNSVEYYETSGGRSDANHESRQIAIIVTFLARMTTDYLVILGIDPRNIEQKIPLSHSSKFDRVKILDWVAHMIGVVKNQVMKITGAEEDEDDNYRLILP